MQKKKHIDDAISRQAALDAINEYDFDFPQYMERFVTELRDAMKKDLVQDIGNLPSVQPELNCKNCVFRMGYGTGIDEGILNAIPKKDERR